MDELAAKIDKDGFGFALAELADSGEPIGFIGMTYTDHPEPFLPNGSVEIGWRLAPEYWGRGFATEGARAWLAHGFEALRLQEIVSFAVWDNTPSIAVMKRLGMSHDPAEDFDDPQAPADRPDLRRIVIYRLLRDDWRSRA